MSTTEETRIEWTGNIQVHHPVTVQSTAKEFAVMCA